MRPKLIYAYLSNIEKREEEDFEERLKKETQEDTPNETPNASLGVLDARTRRGAASSQNTEEDENR